jgi:pimeloyl-ACP methyl ester carboxylesterase
MVDLGGSGVAAILAHANSFPPGTYRKFAEALAPSLHVLGVEQRPLWPNEDWRAFSGWNILGEDLVALLDEMHDADPSPIVGIGHSLGGVAMIYAAQMRPERFKALVLIEPVLLPEALLSELVKMPERILRLPLVISARDRRRRFPSHDAVFAHYRNKRVFSGMPDDILRDYVDCGFHLVDAEAGDGSEVSLSYPPEWEAQIYSTPPSDVWKILPEIEVPTLGLRGAETDTITDAAWKKWQELQPHARFVDLPGLGHLLPFEDPELVAEEIRGFLGGLG